LFDFSKKNSPLGSSTAAKRDTACGEERPEGEETKQKETTNTSTRALHVWYPVLQLDSRFHRRVPPVRQV
jgi:hypothetical protein